MSVPISLGSFEQLVLLALVRLRENAYGMTIRREIEERTGRAVSLGAVYATLDRMETKKLVSSNSGDTSPEREGRARRYFKMEKAGIAALRGSLQMVEQMSAGIDPAWLRGGTAT